VADKLRRISTRLTPPLTTFAPESTARSAGNLETLSGGAMAVQLTWKGRRGQI
jgi:hypothetical protein